MNISEIKNALVNLDSLNFKLETGSSVPQHFHVTEVGVISKDFIDCGGTRRSLKVANFQLWSAKDYDHRLKAAKLLNIIEMSEKILDMQGDLEIEVEYQMDTIGKYNLDFDGENFILQLKTTDCLAKDKCGPKKKVKLSELAFSGSCNPDDGCC
jgi:hypothetical protein